MRQMAAHWKCALLTASHLVACHSSTGSVYPLPKTGRKPKCTCYNLLTIKRSIMDHRFMPLPQLCRHLKDYHQLKLGLTTLCHVVYTMGYSCPVAQVKPLVNRAARSKQLLYARTHRFDKPWEWRRTLRCVEAAIRLNAPSQVLVTMKDGKAFKVDCSVPKLLGGGGGCISIMIWGAIYFGGRSELWHLDT